MRMTEPHLARQRLRQPGASVGSSSDCAGSRAPGSACMPTFSDAGRRKLLVAGKVSASVSPRAGCIGDPGNVVDFC